MTGLIRYRIVVALGRGRTIDSVIDIKAFNAEVTQEAEDAAHLEGVRSKVNKALSELIED